jgi:DNA polymerase-3 subunit epsilon
MGKMRSNIVSFIADESGPEGFALSTTDKSTLLEFFPDGLIAIDLETTGLSPLVDRIIEIALFKVTKDSCEVFQTLINPEIPIPPHTTAIHNITDEMVTNAPLLNDVLDELKSFVGHYPIVAHNAKFDLGFIVMGMQKGKLPLAANPIYCSCKLSRHTHKETSNHKLATLVKELDIPLVNHHRALDDAFASLKVFISSLGRISAAQRTDLREYGHLFDLDQFERVKAEEIPAHLKPLEKLVKEAAVIEMLYTGGNHKNKYRPIKLMALLNTTEGSVVYARCLWSGMQKSFKLSKVSEIRSPSAEDIQKWLKNV